MVDFLGISFDKYFKKGSQAYSLGLKLLATAAHENLGHEAVRQVCISAYLKMEKSMDSKSLTDSSQKTRDSDAHKECLQAKDYEGCMRFNQSGKSRSKSEDLCEDALCLVRTKVNDVYGLPKPWNYMYRQLEDGRLMYWSRFYRIPHKGQEARYIGFKRITRYDRTPEAGISGSFIGGGSASTNCTGYGASVNCTTTGSLPNYLPGRSASPGGIFNWVATQVFDCKDMTKATYQNGKLYTGWRTYKHGEFFSRLLKDKCESGPSELTKLPTLDLEM